MLSLIEKAIALKKIYIFENLSAEEIRIMAGACEESIIRKGEIIFRQGENTETLRLIILGVVQIILNMGTASEFLLSTLKAGDYFAEMNLFDGEPHSASAIAIEECHLLLMRKERVNEIINLYPEISLELIKVISRRLRAADRRLSKVLAERDALQKKMSVT